MTLTKTKRWMIRGGVIAAAVVGGAFAACKAEGPPRPTCGDVVDGGTRDALAIPVYTAVTTDAQPIEVYGMDPDPGPACLDCTQDSDSEIMVVADFEDGFAPGWFNYGEPGVLIEPPQAGNAIDMNGVTDPMANPPPPYWGLQVSTLAQAPGGERCGSKFALHMEGGRFSVWGGGYVTRHFITRGEYMFRENLCGSRDDHPLDAGQPNVDIPGDPEINGTGTKPRYMPATSNDTNRETATGCMFWASPVTTQPSLLGVDVSDFDGVTFWARRGPSGQSTLRIALVDDSTSEDLALQQERDYCFDAGAGDGGACNPDNAGTACKRVETCCRKCDDQLEHQQWVSPKPDAGITQPDIATVTEARCHVDGERLPEFRERPAAAGGTEIVAWDFRNPNCGDVPTTEDTTPVPPGEDAGARACWSTAAQEIWDSWDRDYALCCPTTLQEEVALGDPNKLYGDPRWGGTKCRPYVFNFDYSSGNYCHNEGDVLPEKNQNRCGESFEAALVVDTEWKLFRIPWSELRRFTPDKPPFNPKSVWQVAFYFGAGFLDTYIDDVGFYRKRR